MKLLIRMPLAFTIMYGISSSISLFAASCKEPDENTEFCRDIDDPKKLGGRDEFGACEEIWAVLERNQFPKGSVDADEGATTEEREDCWRRMVCVEDPDSGDCVVDATATEEKPWHKEDKVVEDTTKTCPEA